MIIFVYESISIYINQYQFLSSYINLYQYICICTYTYISIPIYINLYESITIYINPYEFISIYLYEHILIYFFIDLYLSISFYIYLYLFIKKSQIIFLGKSCFSKNSGSLLESTVPISALGSFEIPWISLKNPNSRESRSSSGNVVI